MPLRTARIRSARECECGPGADRRALVGWAAATAANARDLLSGAELLLEAGRWPRAYALAVLAAEEWGTAYAVITLSFMPDEVKAQVPVRDF